MIDSERMDASPSPRLRGEGAEPLAGFGVSPKGEGEVSEEPPPQSPLTLGCRLALPTTGSAKPSPRKRGEGLYADEP